MAAKNEWTLKTWDCDNSGNKCWVKKFGKGEVSVGVGTFLLVNFSYGPNSDHSMSGTRWHYGTTISEQDMMNWIDENEGKHKSMPVDPKLYKDWFDSCSKEVQDALLAVGQPWHQLCLNDHNRKLGNLRYT